ncbi:thioredoxin H9-like isoform X2 [Primulina huaijiensis]|uniref:thioredoxin H9-like isoform X2 n=1 Tax=Primulina huaijiensis TaxID=1492673 RepID=UPI003CC72268
MVSCIIRLFQECDGIYSTMSIHLFNGKSEMCAGFHIQAPRVIANFSASWCGPCRIIAPFYVELSEKHQSVMFLTVDVDELTEFSTSWDIKATPTFFFLKDGQQLDKLVGANKPELQKKVTAILDSKASCET